MGKLIYLVHNNSAKINLTFRSFATFGSMESQTIIPRALAPVVTEKLSKSKILVLRGPRKSGKKTLLSTLLPQNKSIILDCAGKHMRKALSETASFREIAGDHTIVILDEAQLLGNLQELIDDALGNDRIENLILCCSFEPVLQ